MVIFALSTLFIFLDFEKMTDKSYFLQEMQNPHREQEFFAHIRCFYDAIYSTENSFKIDYENNIESFKRIFFSKTQ